MISTDSCIALTSFLKATCFYQVGDHLNCIWAMIIYTTLRDQMVIKSRGRHLEFLSFPAWLWMMYSWGHLKGKPPLCFHNFHHRPYQMLPLRARVDLGAMAMKGYSTFPKAPTLLEPHHQMVNVISGHSLGWGSLTPLQRCKQWTLSQSFGLSVEFQLVDYDLTVQHITHCTTKLPHIWFKKSKNYWISFFNH